MRQATLDKIRAFMLDLYVYPEGKQFPHRDTICQNYGFSTVTLSKIMKTFLKNGLVIRDKGSFMKLPFSARTGDVTYLELKGSNPSTNSPIKKAVRKNDSDSGKCPWIPISHIEWRVLQGKVEFRIKS